LPLILLASVFGFVAPVCDCGVIPLARRLRSKGVPAYAATTFIVAAPVVNPVVLLSTAFAFQGNWAIVALRLAMTLNVSIAVGLFASALFPDPLASAAVAPPISGGADPLPPSDSGGIRELVGHATEELFDVIFFIVLGALFTAVTQAAVPRRDLSGVGSRPILSVATLMPVATLLSICSEADAFVARAFAVTFSRGAILAFMAIGQIVDLRNGVLLLRTLGARQGAAIAILAYALVFAEGALINLLWP